MDISDDITPIPVPAGADGFPRRPDRGKVLIVDDSEINGLVTRQLLERRGYRTQVVRAGETALFRLEKEDYDLVCMDVGLPGIDGHEVCRRIRRSPVFGHIPVLMVSASFTDETNVVRGLDAGANDYVRIPFAHQEFLSRVDSLVRMKVAEDRLRALTREDLLTHLGNRMAFFRQLQQEMARAARHHSSLCLSIVDIDFFKRINEYFGHESGDDVLCGMAALLRENMRREDSVFRWGGDEFALLLVEVDVDHARTVLGRILGQVESTDFSLTDKQLHTTASAGLGQYNPAVHEDRDAFTADVEKALNRAKQDGRGQIALTT